MNDAPKQSRRATWLIGVLAVLAVAMGVRMYYTQPGPPEVPVVTIDERDSKLAKVVREAREQVEYAPDSAEAWSFYGRVLLVNEVDHEAALVCFNEAERLEPKNPRWPYFAGALLRVDFGKPEEAVPRFERAVALDEKNRQAPLAPRLTLADTLRSLERLDEAEEHYKQVVALEPENPRAHFGLGVLAYRRGDALLSRTHLEACLGSAESRKKAASLLAAVCERMGDKEASERYASYAARMPKDFDWTDPYVVEHLKLAVRERDRYRAVENLEAQGEFGFAASILAQMVAEDPNDYQPHLVLGRILPQMGEFQRAEEHLLRARELAPEKLQVHYLLSLVWFHQGERLWLAPNGDREKAKALFEKSAASARKVLEIRSDYGFAHMALGLALKYHGDRDESLTAFRNAVHCNPEYAENHLFLGQALADRGEIDEARSHLKQAQLLSSPNDPRAKEALEKLGSR
jgi:tetratricopeptide (TPR) repeat protein